MKNLTELLDPQGDAIRLMKKHAGRLLLVQYRDHHGLLSLDDNGAIWSGNPTRLWDWHRAVAADHAAAIAASDATITEIRNATGYLRRARTRRGFERMQDAVGGAFLHMKESGDIPQGLIVCQAEDLDRDPRYLGSTNGVVDLNVGRLLPAGEGRQQLISRNTGVAFDPEARDGFVDDMLALLSSPERLYLLAALGHALRGGRSGRWYLLCGAPGSGKSTLLGTIAAALGVVQSGGYAFYLADGLLISGRHTSTTRFADHLRDFTRGRIALGDDLYLDGARLNRTLVKSLTGGDLLPRRDQRDMDGVPAPVTATIFQAMLLQDMDHLDLSDPTLVDRTHVMSYLLQHSRTIRADVASVQALVQASVLPQDMDHLDLSDPAEVDKTHAPSCLPQHSRMIGAGPTSVLITDQARRAMLALLVQHAAENPEPPEAPASVTQLLRERRRASIGSVGRWLLDHLQVTGDGDETVLADEIMAALAEDIPPDDQARFQGRSRREVLALARDLIDGFPTARQVKRGGRLVSAYSGLRLLTAADIHPAGAALPADIETRRAVPETPAAYTLGYCRACRNLMLEILQKSHLTQHTEEELRSQQHPCLRCETLLPAGSPFQLLCADCAGKTRGDLKTQTGVMAAIAAEMDKSEGGMAAYLQAQVDLVQKVMQEIREDESDTP